MRAIEYADELGTRMELEEIPQAYVDEAQKWRERLVESLAEVDDEIMEAYLDGKEVSREKIKEALRFGTINLKLVPLLCGSALKIRAFSCCWMRSSITCRLRSTFLPSRALILNGEEVVRHTDPEGPLTALAFKVLVDPYVGRSSTPGYTAVRCIRACQCSMPRPGARNASAES